MVEHGTINDYHLTMEKHPIIPAEMQSIYDDWRMSPGIAVGDLVFLTGFNGMGLDGTVSDNPVEQIETAFRQVEMVLSEGGMTFADVVDVTSYHVGLQDHLSAFREIWARHVKEPYPAWTSIEVVGFVSKDVVVELRVVARKPD